MIYCLDTSPAINLKHYYREVFTGLWAFIDKLIQNGELISCREVYKELEVGGDEMFDWAKVNRRIFRDPDQAQLGFVTTIMAEFPNFVDPNKTVPVADPFIISLARSVKGTVLTNETASKNVAKPKIPDICNHYGIIRPVSLKEFFISHNLRFD